MKPAMREWTGTDQEAFDGTAKLERELSLLLTFSKDLASVRDLNGLRCIIKQFLTRILQINEFIITLRDPDNNTYSYFLHDLAAVSPDNETCQIVTDEKMPIRGSITGVVLRDEEPVIFCIKEIMRSSRYSLPNASFWKAAGAEHIMGVRLRVGLEDVGILWIQPGRSSDRMVKGISGQIAIALAHANASQQLRKQQQALQRSARQGSANARLPPEDRRSVEFTKEAIIGKGPEMQKIDHLLSRVAFASTTVLILGETGTGKELVAQALHAHSPRASRSMVKINCAALPANLIESELFGHEKGSFTGATAQKIGKFEGANDSTLFLDEIGEMPLDLQIKLLRAIQSREIERVGGYGSIKVNTRIIAATNRDLEQEVLAGRFRSDLYYRLNVFPIRLPPLRERLGDIPCLVRHFIKKLAPATGKSVAGISSNAMTALMSHPWPGNVRELENVIERALLMTQGSIMEEVILPDNKNLPMLPHQRECTATTIRDIERDHISAMLKKCKGKVSGPGGAASFLGIPPSTLNSKITKLGIRK